MNRYHASPFAKILRTICWWVLTTLLLLCPNQLIGQSHTNSTSAVPNTVPVSRFSDDDYQIHIEALRKKLPHDEFYIVLQKPFVVIGDENPNTVERRSEHTVRWAIDLLKQDYFSVDPEAIIDIWLFRDKTSYKNHNLQLFNRKPSTPYGFYSSADRALVMNISTGGGTLVHEIVHPFIESNFPDCPAWFNEGLASLYEQCRSQPNAAGEDQIWGTTNWRLRGLQGIIESNRLPVFKDLCSTTTREFYDDDDGSHYAQARYLCYFLQERGLLRKYYHQFRKDVKQDPTGYQTLIEVLGNPNMEKFNQDWQAWVLKLRF